MTDLQIGIALISAVITVIQGGAVAILVWVFRKVIAGGLVARSVLEDVRKDRDERIADAQETSHLWQAALIESEKARMVHSGQVNQLLETGRIAEALLRSLPTHPHDREPQT